MDTEEINRLLRDCQYRINRIIGIWTDIGICDERLKSRYEKLKHEILENLDNIYNDESERKDCLLKSIFETQEYVKSTCKQLNLEFTIKEFDTLIEKDSFLLEKKGELDVIKNDRLYRLSKLLNEEKTLCEKLFQCEKVFVLNDIPTEEQLLHVKSYVDSLNNIKEKRYQELLKHKETITKLEKTLGRNYQSNALSCNLLFSESIDVIPLSEETLQNCVAVVYSLEKELDINKSKCINLRKQYHDLLKSLKDSYDIEPKYYADITCEIWTDEVINKLDDDVKDLKRMRQEKLGEIIESSKANLVGLMTECLGAHLVHTEPYKSLLNTDEVSENILASFEARIRTWTNVKVRITVIKVDLANFYSAQEESKIKQDLLKDPEIRKNRGGIMLKIQKELKECQSIANNCKRALRTHISSYEDTDVGLKDLKYNDADLWDVLSEVVGYKDADKENKLVQSIRSIHASATNLNTGQIRSIHASSSNFNKGQTPSMHASATNLNTGQRKVLVAPRNYNFDSSKVPRLKRDINPGENASSRRL